VLYREIPIAAKITLFKLVRISCCTDNANTVVVLRNVNVMSFSSIGLNGIYAAKDHSPTKALFQQFLIAAVCF